MRTLILALALTFAAHAQPEAANKAPGAEKTHGEYIDVTVLGTVKAGVMAIGAETTGATITSGAVTWELELAGSQREVASKLDGRKALVSGRLRKTSGVEVNTRFIVKVRSIKAAP